LLYVNDEAHLCVNFLHCRKFHVLLCDIAKFTEPDSTSLPCMEDVMMIVKGWESEHLWHVLRYCLGIRLII